MNNNQKESSPTYGLDEQHSLPLRGKARTGSDDTEAQQAQVDVAESTYHAENQLTTCRLETNPRVLEQFRKALWDVVDEDGIFIFVNMVRAEIQYQQESDGSQCVTAVYLYDEDINGRLIATLIPVIDVPAAGSQDHCQIHGIIFTICGEREEPGARSDDDDHDDHGADEN